MSLCEGHSKEHGDNLNETQEPQPTDDHLSLVQLHRWLSNKSQSDHSQPGSPTGTICPYPPPVPADWTAVWEPVSQRWGFIDGELGFTWAPPSVASPVGAQNVVQDTRADEQQKEGSGGNEDAANENNAQPNNENGKMVMTNSTSLSDGGFNSTTDGATDLTMPDDNFDDEESQDGGVFISGNEGGFAENNKSPGVVPFFV